MKPTTTPLIRNPVNRSPSRLDFLVTAIVLAGTVYYTTALNAQGQSQVYIAIRTDGQPGSGTQSDPYNGSTQAKFDAIMADDSKTPANTAINLGSGTFQSDSRNLPWYVKPGWVIQGAGIDKTICQIVSNMAGFHDEVDFFRSSGSISTDNAAIRNLTIDCNGDYLSSTADTGANNEKNYKAMAVNLTGSNNLVEYVREIHEYGSYANAQEPFGIALYGSNDHSNYGTNNTIRYCRAELATGDHGSAFLLSDTTNSSCYNNTVVGTNDGGDPMFNSGALNIGFISNSSFHDNTVTDCYLLLYSDTGKSDGIQIYNNTITRGAAGVMFAASGDPSWTISNISVTGNTINIQNRHNGEGPGIKFSPVGSAPGIYCANNNITFQKDGTATLIQFWGVLGTRLSGALIHDNTVSLLSGITINNEALGTGATMYNNKWSDGTLIPPLNGPLAPSNLTATDDSVNPSSQIDLAWSDNSSDESGFQIYRSTSQTGGYSLLYTTASNIQTYSDTGLAKGTTYYYEVNAFNSTANSNFSNIAGAQTGRKHR